MSIWFSGERVRAFQWASQRLATLDIAVILAHTGGAIGVMGVILVLMAALAWAGGNIAAIRGNPTNMLAYVGWSSAYSIAPLRLRSLLLEGRDADLAGLRQAS